MNLQSESTMAVRTEDEIRDWIVQRMRPLLLEGEPLDPDEPLIGYGLDSMQVVALAADLEDYLGLRFNENPLFDHPSVNALAKHLAERSGRASGAEL